MRLLVSVRSATEARAALAGGADWIDVKDPSRGPMGRADVNVMSAVAHLVAGRAPVSAALGELHECSREVSVSSHVSYVKVGLGGAALTEWTDKLEAMQRVAAPARLVATAYVESGDEARRLGLPDARDVLCWAIEHRAAGVLLDTCVKDGRSLFHWRSPAWVAQLIAQARAAGLMIALAGALSGAAFERAAALRPDVVAVRGAACGGGNRNDAVDRDRVAALKQVVSTQHARAAQRAG